MDNYISSICYGIVRCECHRNKKYQTTYQKMYDVGTSKIEAELDVLKIIKNLKNLKILSNIMFLKDKKLKVQVNHNRKNIIDLEEESHSEESDGNKSDSSIHSSSDQDAEQYRDE